MSSSHSNPPPEGFVQRTVTYTEVIPRSEVPADAHIQSALPPPAPEPPAPVQEEPHQVERPQCEPCSRRHVEEGEE